MSGIYDKQTLAGEANGMKKGLTVKSERSWMKTDKASSLEKLINKPLQLDINKYDTFLHLSLGAQQSLKQS